MKWTEGEVHRAMRHHLKASGWSLIAGEYPGGSDHELYPLNIVDPAVARDRSPDPRRHSKGELIPDLVALRSGMLIVVEAKPVFSEPDRQKLETMLVTHFGRFSAAFERFCDLRRLNDVPPITTLAVLPVLAFPATCAAPRVLPPLSYLRVADRRSAHFEGYIEDLL